MRAGFATLPGIPPTISGREDEPASRGPVSKSAFWDAVIRAGDHVDRLVAYTSVRLPTPEEDDLLHALREETRAYLDGLRDQMSNVPEIERLMLALILYFDERIMGQLPDTSRHRWEPLQIDWIGSSHGGIEFYRILDRLAQDAQTPAILFEVFYYCLNNGFVGRYGGNQDGVEAYKRYLRSRIAPPTPDVASARDTPARPGPLPVQRHPAWYYLGTAIIIIVITLSMTALTNC